MKKLANILKSLRPYTIYLLILFAVSLACAYKAVKAYATDSDALTYNYLVKGSPLHKIVLPGQHTNLLKLPYFWITDLFPFNYHTFLFFSVLLVLVSIGLWTWLVTKVFPRKYTPLIIMLLSALIFSSSQFDINIAENTIRNIEFPICLAFILIINFILKGVSTSKRQNSLIIFGSLLYALLLSGDNYFLYACSLPLLIVIAVYWLQSTRLTRPMLKALAFVIGTAIISLVIKAIVGALGIAVINKNIAFHTTIVTSGNFIPSVVTAFSQYLNLQGAYIFGQDLSLHNLAIFINFILLIVGFIGLICIIFTNAKKYRKTDESIASNNGFILTTLSISFLLSFLVYIFSGQVVQNVNGSISSLGQIRYLAFTPFISMLGLVYLMSTYYKKHVQLKWLVIIVLAIELVTVYPLTKNALNTDINAMQQPSFTLLDQEAAYLNKHDTREVLTGYWDGPPLEFDTQGKIKFASIVNCNYPFVFNVRKDWYTPSKSNINSALIVDKDSSDKLYWACSDDQLESIYGKPYQVKKIGTVSIWLYHYDVREKLRPFALEYY